MRLRPVNKYRAKRTTVDGVTFHSAKEAARYQELRLLEKAGEVTNLELQPRFPLFVPYPDGRGNKVAIGTYVGDFRYFDEQSAVWIVEDVKGFDTPLSKWKRKHVKAQYGIKVRLT